MLCRKEDETHPTSKGGNKSEKSKDGKSNIPSFGTLVIGILCVAYSLVSTAGDNIPLGVTGGGGVFLPNSSRSAFKSASVQGFSPTDGGTPAIEGL